MRLKNRTDFPDHFLRRMIAWCCREIGLPVRTVSSISFGNRSDGRTSGRAWWPSNRIHISVGGTRAMYDKSKAWGYFGEKDPEDQQRRRTNSLVSVTAHELGHVLLYREGRSDKARERRCETIASRVVKKFKANRDRLLADWSKEPLPKTRKPKASLQEQRATAAQDKLGIWQRKLKLAQTKIKKYKQRVRYYDRVLAAKKAEKGA